MSENPKRAAPPYASFSSFLNFINKLKETGVPDRIDPSVFGNASGSISYSIIAALKAFKMIGADGAPSKEFVDFVDADDAARKPMMARALMVAFPTLASGAIKLETTSAAQFDDHLRDEYDVKGSTVDKVATFFIAAANFAELSLSAHLKARKPVAASSSAKKSNKQRKTEIETPASEVKKLNGQSGEVEVQGLNLDPLLVQLLKLVPAKETGWPKERRLRWLRALATNISQIYDDPLEPIDFKIEIDMTAGL